MPPFKKIALQAPVTVCYNDTAAAGLQVDGYIFVSDDYYEIIEMREVHDVVGGSSAAVVIRRCASGTTIGSGDAVGATAFDLTATADTPQRRAVSADTMSATKDFRMLSPGQSLGADYSGTLTGLLGVAITITLRRTRAAANQNR